MIPPIMSDDPISNSTIFLEKSLRREGKILPNSDPLKQRANSIFVKMNTNKIFTETLVLHVYRSRLVTAFSTGGAKKGIFISDQYMRRFNDDEIAFGLAHELGHIVLGHAPHTEKDVRINSLAIVTVDEAHTKEFDADAFAFDFLKNSNFERVGGICFLYWAGRIFPRPISLEHPLAKIRIEKLIQLPMEETCTKMN